MLLLTTDTQRIRDYGWLYVFFLPEEVLLQESQYDSCCYTCYTLRPYEIHVESEGRVEKCEPGHWPDSTRQACQLLRLEQGYRASSPPGKVSTVYWWNSCQLLRLEQGYRARSPPGKVSTVYWWNSCQLLRLEQGYRASSPPGKVSTVY
jgi:hypothetical protein